MFGLSPHGTFCTGSSRARIHLSRQFAPGIAPSWLAPGREKPSMSTTINRASPTAIHRRPPPPAPRRRPTLVPRMSRLPQRPPLTARVGCDSAAPVARLQPAVVIHHGVLPFACLSARSPAFVPDGRGDHPRVHLPVTLAGAIGSEQGQGGAGRIKKQSMHPRVPQQTCPALFGCFPLPPPGADDSLGSVSPVRTCKPRRSSRQASHVEPLRLPEFNRTGHRAWCHSIVERRGRSGGRRCEGSETTRQAELSQLTG